MHAELTEYRAMEVAAGSSATHGILPQTAYDTDISPAHHNLIARAFRDVCDMIRTQL